MGERKRERDKGDRGREKRKRGRGMRERNEGERNGFCTFFNQVILV